MILFKFVNTKYLIIKMFMLWLITTIILRTSTADCPKTWFECGNGRCLAEFWVCDGENDCGNGQDELNCGDLSGLSSSEEICTDTEIQCLSSGKCISEVWQCDGEDDCIDGTDEQNCDQISNCDGYQCKNHQCIPHRWHCDGSQDCKDGSDEQNCNYTSTTDILCTKEHGKFLCNSGNCIDLKQVCDDKINCVGGEDEGGHCDTNECQNSNCSHGCQKIPEGHECTCPDGYQLNINGITCEDVNECENSEHRYCSQYCENTVGGYYCLCQKGYTVVNNSCKADGPEPLLIFSNVQGIRGLWLNSQRFFPVHKSLASAVGLTFDELEGRVYWVDINTEATGVYSSLLDGSNFHPVVTNGFATPEDIAFDWLARNLYITDAELKKIIVCKTDGSVCHVLFLEKLDKPRSLVLDPPRGLMYWTDWGRKPAIIRSGMDGSDKTLLVDTDIIWPNGLTIDYTLGWLYWADAKLNKIEYLTLDGKQRKIILQDGVFHPFSLAVFEDLLYWSDWSSFSLESCNKFTGKEQQLIFREHRNHLLGIHIYHPILSEIAPNPCWIRACSHLCLVGTEGKHRCVCPPGYLLDTDEKTCLSNLSDFILISEYNNVLQFNEESIGHDVIKKLPVTHLQDVGDLAYDWHHAVVYLSDIHKKIILAFNMSDFKTRLLVDTHLQTVEGLDFDWIGQNIYWVDAEKGTLEVITSKGYHRAILASNLSRPIHIALYPEKGVLFVALLGIQPAIVQFDMDGNNRKLVVSKHLGIPVSLAIDRWNEKLVWADSKKGLLSSIKVEHKQQQQIIKMGLGHLSSVAVGENGIYWMDVEHHALQFFHYSDPERKIFSVHLPTSLNNTSAMRKLYYVHMLNISAVLTGAGCEVDNGKCNHLCLVNSVGHTCGCSIGYALDDNGKTCEEEIKGCKKSEVSCANATVCIPEIWKCDGRFDCPDESDEKGCDNSCPNDNFRCNNGLCIVPSWVCDLTDDCGDGSDEQNCSNVKTCGPNQFDCGEGQCISMVWLCDGEKDCALGHDESNCEVKKCTDTEFRCSSGQCIPMSWKCDEEPDCSDGSDENCTTSPSCKSSDFHCNNNICIDLRLVCDQRDDCQDGSDEVDCDYNVITICPDGMINCENGPCIYNHEICDGLKDCPDGSDEVNCTVRQCDSWEFYCPTKRNCIPDAWLCDGEDDCGNKEDETLPKCHNTKVVKIATPVVQEVCKDFMCKSGECISWSLVCDRKPDCLDYSDEHEQCGSSCSTNNGGCAHICQHTPKGALCSCRKGYALMKDLHSCDDIDECTIKGHCSHFCNNTKGGFKCSCASGYILGTDHQYCKAKGGIPDLLYILPNEIRALTLRGMSNFLVFQKNIADLHGLDYNFKDQLIYWSEWKEGIIGSFSSSSGDSIVLVKELHQLNLLCYDWIGRNLYFTNGNGKIGVCTETGMFCTELLDTKVFHLSSFTLSPLDGLMFWSISSSLAESGSGIISRGNMDGSETFVLVTKVHWPVSLTIDHVLKQLFWADVKMNTIEASDFNGKNRHTVIQEGVHYPFSIALFEDYLFWTDWGTDTILRCNKFTGQSKFLVHRGDVKAEIMTVVHSVRQPEGPNPCNGASCQQLCLLVPGSYTCHCMSGFNLANDSSSCLPTFTEMETPTQPLPTEQPSATICKPSYCFNGGECIPIKNEPKCRCPTSFHGSRCEHSQQPSRVGNKDYSWVAGVVLGLFFIAFILALSVLLCYKHNKNLRVLGHNVAVGFKNPMFGLRNSGQLVLDGENEGVDEYMLGKQGAYRETSCFGNRGFNDLHNVEHVLLPQDGEFRRWPSRESQDSAFGSDCQPREGSCVDQASLNSRRKGDRLIYFFKKL
ncbi:putative vitellogenin receptor yl isoform X2 [Tachypleus tridentatus]|uniref:putative vitellogenin receptor yl isoform X2 n=1 Tax=Tachypleus tridentatus TaxID=6853 RepID=UPI003FD2C4E0